jgi:hypothetical protein
MRTGRGSRSEKRKGAIEDNASYSKHIKIQLRFSNAEFETWAGKKKKAKARTLLPFSFLDMRELLFFR